VNIFSKEYSRVENVEIYFATLGFCMFCMQLCV